MEAEGDSGKSQLVAGPGNPDSRGTKNPRRDEALLRELRKEEKQLKDEERQLMKEKEERNAQSRDLLDRMERNAQRQLLVTNEIRRLSQQQMRAVKARSLTEETAAALDEHGDPANGGELKPETAAALNGHEADAGAAAANGGEQMVETAALDEHYVDGGGDEEHMDCDMEDQVPRIDSKSESEAEAAIGPHTNESTIESNISVSDKIIPKPTAHHLPINRGDDVVDKMDCDISSMEDLVPRDRKSVV